MPHWPSGLAAEVARPTRRKRASTCSATAGARSSNRSLRAVNGRRHSGRAAGDLHRSANAVERKGARTCDGAAHDADAASCEHVACRDAAAAVPKLAAAAYLELRLEGCAEEVGCRQVVHAREISVRHGDLPQREEI